MHPQREGASADAATTDWRRSFRIAGLNALAVPVVYGVFGALWILVSDLFLESLHLSPHWTTRIAMAKGWVFVGGSTVLIGVLVNNAWRRLDRAFSELRQELQLRKVAQEEASRLARELELRVDERTAHLHAALAELGMFTDSVSHDLRAPVRAIRGFSAILQEDHGPSLHPDALALLERVVASGGRMERMIDGLLDLSRLRRDAIVFQNLSPDEHRRMVVDLWNEIAMGIPEGGIDFVCGRLPGCRADPRLLEIVWRNLLGNAAKYTRGRPAPRVEVRDHQGWFEVVDNGVGFEAQSQDDIFKPFRRLHSSSEFEGEGIGLALVRRVLDRHDGQIEGYGVPGQGATFRFRLPAHPI
jgi:signal transduction histidine kinase